jgi:hypothetical protein
MRSILRLGPAITLALAATVAACSGDTMPNGSTDVTLSVVNALGGDVGAQFKLDLASVALPTAGHASTVTVFPGAHRIQLSSAAGQSLVDTTISIAAGGRHTVVFSGSGVTSAGISVATDTISTNQSGNGYRSIVGSVLLVHSAPGLGPYDVVVYQANSDSVYRFGGFSFGAGSLPPPAPYGYYIPFVPATYTFTVTNPGATTALASAQLTLATDDRWTVALTTSIEGGLVLRATKQ